MVNFMLLIKMVLMRNSTGEISLILGIIYVSRLTTHVTTNLLYI